jgi:acetylornithine deacetylase/succinyl-diaminopimelate desuccinylase-like protein
MRRIIFQAVVCVFCALSVVPGQTDAGNRLLQEPLVKQTLEWVRLNEGATIADQIRLCEIPAPPYKERNRAEAYRLLFQELGLKNVRIDKVGNVLGERPGASRKPHLLFSAHLDTVFPEGTPVKTTRQGSVIKGPGIGDDSRGLAVVLAVIRALNHAKMQTHGTITFAGTVGEEGLGDLRGVKHLFGEELKGQIDRFVSVDGTGLSITHVAVGSYRYRISFKGTGGHSFGAFGMANPIHALGRAIARISDFQVPEQPRTTFNVGRIGGGTSINSIAYEAWMEVDMRSSDSASLDAVDRQFHAAVNGALDAENARWKGTGRLTVAVDRVGTRPAGRLPEDSPIVQTSIAVTRALGLAVSLREGSTDSNVPIHFNIPAVTIGGGGRGSGGHSPAESFDMAESWLGTQRALLLALALSRN